MSTKEFEDDYFDDEYLDEDEEVDEYDDDDDVPARSSRKRFWFVALFLILLLIFFLPNLAMMTPLKDRVIGMALQDVQGNVSVESVSAGWFSKTRLSGVKVDDENGNTVIQSSHISMSKSLLAFLTDSNLGSIEITDPVIDLKIRKKASNIEDIFEKYIYAESSGKATPEIEVTIVNGSIRVTNETDQSQSQLNHINGQLAFRQADGLTAELAGKNPENENATVQITCSLPANEKRFSYESGSIKSVTNSADASILGAILTRVGYQVSMAGSVTGNANVQWSESFSKLSTDLENLQFDRAIIVAPDYIGSDQLTMQRIQAHGLLGFNGNNIETKNLLVQSDVGSLKADGTIDLNQLSNLLTRGRLTESDFQTSGAIDIAALSRMLPTTIRLHDGVVIDSGKLTFQSFSRVEGIYRRLLLNAEIQKIAGRRNGQSFNWQQPVRIAASARQSKDETLIESVEVKSASFDVSGAGSLKQADFTAKGDLARLASDLSQFIDLSHVRLAGQFAGRLRWTPTGETTGDLLNKPMDLQSSFRFTRADIKLPGIYELSEPQLDFQMHARGNLNRQQGIKLETATAILTAQKDQLKFHLTRPVKNLNLNSTLLGHFTITGEANRWKKRLQPFLPNSFQFETAGKTNLSGDVVASREKISCTNINGTFEQFAFDGFGLKVREPKVIVGGHMTLDLAKEILEIPDATASSSSIAIRANNTRVNYGSDFKVIGFTAFRANLSRVSQWVPAITQSSIGASGAAEGTAQIGTDGKSFQGSVDTTIQKLVLQDRSTSKPIWDEPTAKLNAKFTTKDFDRFDFEKIKINSKALVVDANGSVNDIYSSWNTQLKGRWQPNWDVIGKIAATVSGQKIDIRGSTSEAFQISGPVFATTPQSTPASTVSTLSKKSTAWVSSQLQVDTKVAWQSANVAGIDLGAASFPVALKQQYLSIERLKMNTRTGRLDLAPGLDLRSATPVFHLRSGSSANDIQLTPEACAGFLKYIAPPVANATRAQGTFSVQTQNVQLPISSPLQGNASGTLAIKKATLQSGPLADQILGLAKSVKRLTEGGNILNQVLGENGGLLNAQPQNTQTWVTMPAQQIPFEMQKGRVYHKDAVFQIDDVTVKTSGYVGADQSVQMIASVQVLDKWVEGKSWLQSLKGQSIQIPIRGTLTQPKLDTNVMRQLSTQFLRKNLGNTLQQKANDRLNREIQKNLGKGVEQGLKKLFGK